MQHTKKHIASLIAGIALFAVVMAVKPFGLDMQAVKVLAVATLMITWWVTQALPMPVVALLPIILFPILGIANMEATTAPYANPIIFLFMGGFMIALAIEKWGLHRRAALGLQDY